MADKYEQHREAGKILAQVREETADRVELGVRHIDVAEFAEDRIRELGGNPAFPVNISVNEEAAHSTPAKDEETTFGEDMINLDIGVHLDGWIADTAITVDLSGTPDLVEASAEALEAAIELVEPGVQTGTIGAEIESVINGYGYNPVVNLSGHGLGHWEQHTSPNIPNRNISQTETLEIGQVVAIEPFATDGTGKVNDGNKIQIYALNREQPVRNRDARVVLDQVSAEYRTLPFAVRWLDNPRAQMALRRLEMQDVVHGYPVLKEADGCLVSQKEHTVIVTESGCEVVTRPR